MRRPFYILNVLVFSLGALSLFAAKQSFQEGPFPTCPEIFAAVGDPRLHGVWRNAIENSGPRFQAYVDSLAEKVVFGRGKIVQGPFRREVEGSQMLVREAFNQRLKDFDFGPFSSAELRSMLRGKKNERAVIVVHQDKGEIQALNAKWLGQTRFEKAPRLLLVSDDFRLESDRLRANATVVEYSNLGEFDSITNADEIHITGGAVGVCLTKALQFAVETALDTRASVKVHIYPALTYGAHTTRMDTEELTREFADQAVIGDSSEEANNRRIWGIPQRIDAQSPTYRYHRQRDGKTLLLVIEPETSDLK